MVGLGTATATGGHTGPVKGLIPLYCNLLQLVKQKQGNETTKRSKQEPVAMPEQPCRRSMWGTAAVAQELQQSFLDIIN